MACPSRPANTEPNAAIPRAYPIWRKVLTAPLAMPDRGRGTAASAAETSTGEASPTPAPVTTRPGISAVQPDPAVMAIRSSEPAPISSSPIPSGNRGGMPCMNRPATAETTKATPAIGSSTSPAAMAGRPRTDCSQSCVYTVGANAHPVSRTPAAIRVLNDGRRNRARSRRGCGRRRSTAMNAASAAAVSASAPRVTGARQPESPPWISA